MEKENLEILLELSAQLRKERVEEIKKEYGSIIETYENEKLYNIDDGDNLLEGLDIVISAIKNLKENN